MGGCVRVRSQAECCQTHRSDGNTPDTVPPQQSKDSASAEERHLVDGRGKMDEIPCVGDQVQVEVQVDDLELFGTGSKIDGGKRYGGGNDPARQR